MSFYAEMSATALELLTEFGQTVTLKRVTPGTYNPATGTATPVVTTQSRKAAIFDYNDFRHGMQNPNGLVIEAGDRRCYMDANGVDPELDDQIIIGGVTWSIKNVKSINPSGVSVLHDIHIRR